MCVCVCVCVCLCECVCVCVCGCVGVWVCIDVVALTPPHCTHMYAHAHICDYIGVLCLVC